MPTLQFLGAAGTVTGSRFVFRGEQARIMIDCGLFQGLKALRLRNREPLAIEPAELDAVLLTHGHLDHVGYVPCLVRDGFRGAIYCSEPTRAIAEVVLRDGARIQEEEAERANRKGYSRHKPALPLYTERDVERSLKHFVTVPRGQWQDLQPGCRARWQPVGHILGACFIELDLDGARIVASGDVGREHDLLLPPPERPTQADLLLLESTYGNRLHPQSQPEAELSRWIQQVLSTGASLFLPVFAVERTQLLLYVLYQLRQQGQIPEIPIILDTPMGNRILELFAPFHDWHHLSAEDSEALTQGVQVVESVQHSLRLARKSGPRIVLAGSGMLTGGRMLNYLIEGLKNPDNVVLFTGYQAEGTRGRDLLDGAPEIKIAGNWHRVAAQVAQLESLSAHADQAELLDWLGALEQPPKVLYLVHGEAEAALALQAQIQARYGWQVQIAEHNQAVSF